MNAWRGIRARWMWSSRAGVLLLSLAILPSTGVAISSAEPAKPVARELLYVHADWCAPCKQIERDVLSDPGIRTLIKRKYRYRVIDWDSKAGASARKTYGIEGLPVFLFLDDNGTEVSRVTGIRSREEFRQILDSGNARDPLIEQLRQQLTQ